MVAMYNFLLSAAIAAFLLPADGSAIKSPYLDPVAVLRNLYELLNAFRGEWLHVVMFENVDFHGHEAPGQLEAPIVISYLADCMIPFDHHGNPSAFKSCRKSLQRVQRRCRPR